MSFRTTVGQIARELWGPDPGLIDAAMAAVQTRAGARGEEVWLPRRGPDPGRWMQATRSAAAELVRRVRHQQQLAELPDAAAEVAERFRRVAETLPPGWVAFAQPAIKACYTDADGTYVYTATGVGMPAPGRVMRTADLEQLMRHVVQDVVQQATRHASNAELAQLAADQRRGHSYGLYSGFGSREKPSRVDLSQPETVESLAALQREHPATRERYGTL
jgi:hypothetical protein